MLIASFFDNILVFPSATAQCWVIVKYFADRLNMFDATVLIAFVASIAYIFKEVFWRKADNAIVEHGSNLNAPNKATRDILDDLERHNKNTVIFYGSQTGTAEGYAIRLAKEGAARFGLSTMAADLADYDVLNLHEFPPHKIAIFIMATYGEGEPTDNAAEFWATINSDAAVYSQELDEPPLRNLRYVGFGLGNRTYQHFNYMIRRLDKILQKLGAQRIGCLGEGDDGDAPGVMEEQFVAWKELMWREVAFAMGLEEKEVVYEPAFRIDEQTDESPTSRKVYLGEPNELHLNGKSEGPFNATNPFIARVLDIRELFTSQTRNCLHIDIDISDSNMKYTTGDHLAVLPSNPGTEVDRFLKTFALENKRDTVIHLSSFDSTVTIPFPTPTTYGSILQYYLEICAPVTRQLISSLAEFAPNQTAKEAMALLSADVDRFQESVVGPCMNIAQICSFVTPDPWTKVPFSCFVESLPKLRPRYYSISSSSIVQAEQVSLTAVVDSFIPKGSRYVLSGITTNYFMALKRLRSDATRTSSSDLRYAVRGPRDKYNGLRIPVFVRKSKFRLPQDISKPIIMVGPGTGIAPFRGFAQERAALAKGGKMVGPSLLFYGCRKRSEDWLYREEWKTMQAEDDNLTIFNAFSRESDVKVYVQHLLEKHGNIVNDLLLQGAYFYVCGDASEMAREVNMAVIRIISQRRTVSAELAERIVQQMRKDNKYQEDVW